MDKYKAGTRVRINQTVESAKPLLEGTLGTIVENTRTLSEDSKICTVDWDDKEARPEPTLCYKELLDIVE